MVRHTMDMRVCVSRVTSVRQFGTVLHHVQNVRVHRRDFCRTIVERTRIACLTQMVTAFNAGVMMVSWGVRLRMSVQPVLKTPVTVWTVDLVRFVNPAVQAMGMSAYAT